MSFPYETATSGEKALLETQRILGKFGCQSFGTMIDTERGLTIVQFRHRDQEFRLEASWKGYAGAWLREHKHTYRTSGGLAAHEKRALDQARTSVCSVLRDWVKGQVTAVECGIISFEVAFLPHLLDGDGMRLIDRMMRQKALAAAPCADAEVSP